MQTSSSHGRTQDFFQGWANLESGDKSLQQGPGMEPRWESGDEAPEADDELWK